MNNRPLGIFDSGIGGLTIYSAVKKLLPGENFVYLADQKNFPYGEKTNVEIKKIAFQASQFLANQGCKGIIIGCNTATVSAIKSLRQLFPRLFFAGVVPMVKPAVEKSRSGHFIILSTQATQQSDYLKELIDRFAQGKKVYNLACPGLVELIEKGPAEKRPLNNLLKLCLETALRDKKVDVLAAGCTHFPFVKEEIIRFLPPRINFLEPGSAVARQVKKVLIGKKLLAEKKQTDLFFTTGKASNLEKAVNQLLGFKTKAEKVKY